MRGQGEEMYVGYRALPWAHSRFLRVFVPLALWCMAALAGVMVWAMRAPGPSVWESGDPREWRGTLRELPYPMLETGEGVYFLVELGKRGSQERVAGLDGRSVAVRGWLLEREGRRIIEIAPEDDGVAMEEAALVANRRAPARALGEATLRGEIMDAKCYLGAMRPGDGAGHRACAALCVGGGIPPMLVTRDLAGRAEFHLITGASGEPVNAWAAEWVGQPVEVRGERVDLGGVEALRVGAGGVRSLSARQGQP